MEKSSFNADSIIRVRINSNNYIPNPENPWFAQREFTEGAAFEGRAPRPPQTRIGTSFFFADGILERGADEKGI